MIRSHSQLNRYDQFPPQTSRNELVCIVTTHEFLLHWFLSAPLCYHLQFLRKHQPPIHLLLSMHKRLNCRPGYISVRFNNCFVTVPPAWLERALKGALNSPNTTAYSPTTPIFNQYCELALDRAISFDPLYTVAIFLYILHYMHHYFLLEVIPSV